MVCVLHDFEVAQLAVIYQPFVSFNASSILHPIPPSVSQIRFLGYGEQVPNRSRFCPMFCLFDFVIHFTAATSAVHSTGFLVGLCCYSPKPFRKQSSDLSSTIPKPGSFPALSGRLPFKGLGPGRMVG